MIAVSSGARGISPIRWDDIHLMHGAYDPCEPYGQSKTANVLFARHLDSLAGGRVRAFSLHPGKIRTPLQRHVPRDQQIGLGWIDEHGTPGPGFKTPAQGAATAVWAATSALLDTRGGEYCEDCDIAPLATPETEGGVAAWAIDADDAFRLWLYSAGVTGIDAFG